MHAPAGTSSRMPKNADDLHICSADDFEKQQQLRGIGYAPGMAENLAKRDVFELNDGVKLTQQTHQDTSLRHHFIMRLMFCKIGLVIQEIVLVSLSRLHNRKIIIMSQ